MKVPKEIVQLVSILRKNGIDYRIVGGQAAVLYGLRDDSEDWDIAIEAVTPELKEIMKTIGFTEIPDSEGKSWEGQCLVDFIIGDGEIYPTLDQLGLKITHDIKFVSRSMMGYINWKDGESAFQKLEQYKQDLKNAKLPKAITENYDVEWLKKSTLLLRLVLAKRSRKILH